METHYEVSSPRGQSFAVLDSNTTRVLRDFQGIGHVRLQLLLKQKSTMMNMSSANAVKTSQKTGAEVSITLYAHENRAQKFGDLLGEAGKYLQHPDIVDAGIYYINPQYFRSPAESSHLDHLVGTGADGPLPIRSILSEVDAIMDSLNKTEDSQDIIQGSGVLTPLMRYLPSIS